eukprot:520077-Pleurochrysis_carterae.AAC.1
MRAPVDALNPRATVCVRVHGDSDAIRAVSGAERWGRSDGSDGERRSRDGAALDGDGLGLADDSGTLRSNGGIRQT